MRNIGKKLQAQSGASLSLALLFFVLCAVAGSIVLSAASAALGRTQNVAQKDQRSYAVESAARLLSGEFQDLGTLRITEKRTINQYVRTTTTSTTTTNDNGTPNDPSDDVTQTQTQTTSETFYTVYYGGPKNDDSKAADPPITCTFLGPDGKSEMEDPYHKNWIVGCLFASANQISNLYAKNTYYQDHAAAPSVSVVQQTDGSELSDFNQNNQSSGWDLPVLSGEDGGQTDKFTISVDGKDELKEKLKDKLNVDAVIQLAGTGTITIDLENGDRSENYEKYRMNLEIPVSEKSSSSEQENQIGETAAWTTSDSVEGDTKTHVEVTWERSFTQTKVTELSWNSPTIRRGNVLKGSE